MVKNNPTSGKRSAPDRVTKPSNAVKKSWKRDADKPKAENANQAAANPSKPKKGGRKKKSAAQVKLERMKKQLAQAMHDISGTKQNHFLKKLVTPFEPDVDMTEFNRIADRYRVNDNHAEEPEPAPLLSFEERVQEYKKRMAPKSYLGKNGCRYAISDNSDEEVSDEQGSANDDPEEDQDEPEPDQDEPEPDQDSLRAVQMVN